MPIYCAGDIPGRNTDTNRLPADPESLPPRFISFAPCMTPDRLDLILHSQLIYKTHGEILGIK